ncbi:MAG: purine-nucleoside phosphorylase [Ignavibacteria bacterium]|nr:purine-nucleoside phosphorylase [Ignavibacteria bacterium]
MNFRHTEALDYIKKIAGDKYDVGIILGTGLGGLVKEIKIKHAIPYSDIPNFPVSTVESHSGKLIFGELSGKKIVAMQGRFHYYEGYSHADVVFPVLVLHALGIKSLLVSNACGGLNPTFRRTDLMIISGHINMHHTSPLINFQGKSAGRAQNFYSKKLIKLAEDIALENGIDVQKGVYLVVQGPNLETVAEYRMTRKLGGDVVGMSTVPEVLAASELGVECLGLSIITDEGFPDTLKVASHHEIVEAANLAEPKLTLLTKKLVERL